MGIFNVQLFNQNLLGGANENFPLFKSPKRQISYVTGPLWTPPEEQLVLVKEGDTLNTGKHNLTFVFAPMVRFHMVDYQVI